MIDRSHALPVVRQAQLAGLSRASVYYLPRATSDADQQLMKRIDAIHLEHPFAGARMLRDLLAREGLNIGLPHVAVLMPILATRDATVHRQVVNLSRASILTSIQTTATGCA